MSLRDKFALGIDISSYQVTVDWSIIKAAGVSFIAARSSVGTKADAMFATHVQGAYNANIPVIAYHAMDPGYYVDALQSLDKLVNIDQYLPAAKDQQWQAFVQSIANKKLYGVALDFEIYKDWAGKTITDGWLKEIALQWMIRLQHQLPQYQVRLFYSGEWFIKGFAPSIESTGCLNPICDAWTAMYPYASGVVDLPDWASLKAQYPPDILSSGGENPPAFNFPSWKFWQFSGDKFTLPGIKGAVGQPSAVDLNFFNGTVEDLNTYLGFAVTPAPAPQPQPQPEPAPVDPTIAALQTQVNTLTQTTQTQFDAIAAKITAVKGVL